MQLTPPNTGDVQMNVAGTNSPAIWVPKGTYFLQLSYNGSGSCHVVHRPRGGAFTVQARVEAKTATDGNYQPRHSTRPLFVTVVNDTELFRVDAQGANTTDVEQASASLMLTPMDVEI